MADFTEEEFTDDFLQSFFQNKCVLITGGLGFLGSNLANRLSSYGARVIILDSLNPLYGGNQFNLNPEYKDKMRIVIGDVRDKRTIDELIAGVDLVYHFAAQVSYIDSSNIPFEDLDVNQKSTLNILEACRNINPKAKILFASSRLVLGRTTSPHIAEDAATEPLSLYGVHKLAAEKYLNLYYNNYGIPATILRLTNPYGPRQQIKHNKYSLVGWFVRLALEGKEITIFGEGTQIRNYIYVDDVVEAFVRCGSVNTTNGQLYFLGSRENTAFREMVEQVIEVVGTGSIRYVDWPKNYERVETGDVLIDTSKIRKAIGWEPSVSLKEGIIRTYRYYLQYKDKY